MAINNLERAIKHIEKAKASLEKRLAKNKKNLERHRQSRKWNYPSLLKPIEELIQKNMRAIEECDTIIKILRCRQNQLYKMIQIYGISRKGNSKRLRRLMGSYQPPELVAVEET